LLGGVTRDLLRQMAVPVLMSHCRLAAGSQNPIATLMASTRP
jgi:hypothetical protein